MIKRHPRLRDAALLSCGLGLGIAGTLGVRTVFAPEPIPDGLGALLGGVGIALGLVGGVLSYALGHAKTAEAEQQAASKNDRFAAVAESALSAAIELSRLMTHVTLCYPERSGAPDLKRAQAQRLAAPEVVEKVLNVQSNVEAFLPKESGEVFGRLWRRRSRMETLIELDASGSPVEDNDWLDLFSERGRSAIGEELEKVREHLRGLASST
jgi:hypothetical protein